MFGQDNNNNNKAVAQNEVATKGAFDSLNETIFRNHHYFFDNKPCIAARFRRHGSDLHAGAEPHYPLGGPWPLKKIKKKKRVHQHIDKF